MAATVHNTGTPTAPVIASVAAPSLTEGRRGALSCDLAGNLRITGSSGGGAVTVADGADVTQGALADTAVSTDAAGTVNAHLRGVVKLLAAGITVSVAAATTGGWTPVVKNGLSTTVSAVKSSAAGTLGGWFVYNPNATVAYVQIFDVATAGAVTLGTTVAKLSIGIPATSGANLDSSAGILFAAGIQVAATTTATGLTAPSTALDCNFWFK